MVAEYQRLAGLIRRTIFCQLLQQISPQFYKSNPQEWVTKIIGLLTVCLEENSFSVADTKPMGCMYRYGLNVFGFIADDWLEPVMAEQSLIKGKVILVSCVKRRTFGGNVDKTISLLR